MNGLGKAVVALLGLIAIEGAITAVGIMRIAREGLQLELTIEEANSLAEEVQEAREAAENDMEEQAE